MSGMPSSQPRTRAEVAYVGYRTESPATRFVVVGTQRTGTTLVRTALDAHGSIRCIGEAFLIRRGRFPFWRRTGTTITGGYRQFIDASTAHAIGHLVWRRNTVIRFLDHLYGAIDVSAVGFKLMYGQIRKFPEVLDYLMARDVRVLHVVRTNVLKTHISRVSAQNRRLYHTTRSVQAERLTISPKHLVGHLRRISEESAKLGRIFNRSQYLTLAYEDFVSHQPAQNARICAFLNVEPDPTMSSTLVKINPDRLCDLLENYDEIEAALAGTEYEWCLESDRPPGGRGEG